MNISIPKPITVSGFGYCPPAVVLADTQLFQMEFPGLPRHAFFIFESVFDTESHRLSNEDIERWCIVFVCHRTRLRAQRQQPTHTTVCPAPTRDCALPSRARRALPIQEGRGLERAREYMRETRSQHGNHGRLLKEDNYCASTCRKRIITM